MTTKIIQYFISILTRINIYKHVKSVFFGLYKHLSYGTTFVLRLKQDKRKIKRLIVLNFSNVFLLEIH